MTNLNAHNIYEQLLKEKESELEELRYKLYVAEDTIEAIRTGAVDAVVVRGEDRTKIFTLEGAEQTYRVLVERMSEGAITLNQQGLILYSNSRFADLMNVPLNQVIGSSFSRFLPVEFQEKFYDLFNKAWNGQMKGEFVLHPLGETPVHVYISLNSIVSNNESVLGIIITNLSEQKELEKLTKAKEDLSVRNEELKKVNSDLDNFIYTASHDLKAPVSNIEGLMSALREALDNEESRASGEELFGLINKSIERFKNTIKDLTEITKIQKNLNFDEDFIDCAAVIDEVKSELNLIISKLSAEVKVETAPCSAFNFSRKNFQSIIYNLLSNALKYHSPQRKPEILIKTEDAGDFLVLTVKDNGLGMKLTEETRIFSMFRRLHDHVEGSGIGLYLVKRIIDNSGGKIEVESKVDEGSVFKVYLKIQRAS